jgi:Tfp pilus assembly protein PilV
MNPRLRRRRRAGFTYVEVTASMAVLVLGVMGFAGTVVYTGNLSRSTTQLWRENVAAVDALEDVRLDAAGQWQSIGTNWDGREVAAEGSNATDSTLTTSVNDDPSRMTSGDGMWTDGQTTPNFFHVSISAGSSSNAQGAALNFQTYVADRTGFRSLVADPYTSNTLAEGGETGVAKNDAERLNLTPKNVLVTGAAGDRLTFQLKNGSSTTLQLKGVSVRISNDRSIATSVGGTSFYDNPLRPIGSKLLRLSGVGVTKALAPGLIDFAVTGAQRRYDGKTSLVGRTITVKMKFKDGSYATTVVKP